jgi:ubiquinone/menaquinone biosynthesis C-methylase UbiE
MAEKFKPRSNTPQDSAIGKIKFYIRIILDLQLLTIYRDIKKEIPHYEGNVLDVGCGSSPYRFLLNPAVNYFGIDITDAEKFDYKNPSVTPFNGEDIPFEDEKFDAFLCTEVLEHVEKYQKLTDEIYRVLKKNGKGILTIPWSARYHYMPWDYFRYTPSSLKKIFERFSSVDIKPRGTDISVIGSKIIVLFFRNLLPREEWRYLLIPVWILLSPILVVAVIISQLSLIFNLGSDEDPLGYTILVKK